MTVGHDGEVASNANYGRLVDAIDSRGVRGLWALILAHGLSMAPIIELGRIQVGLAKHVSHELLRVAGGPGLSFRARQTVVHDDIG